MLLLSPLILAPSCYFTPAPTPSAFKLGVPYRAQLSQDYCGPAAVLMWRLFRGGSEVTQDQIYTSMGGGGWGRSPAAISAATSTWAGIYTEVDYEGKDNNVGDPQVIRDKFFAREAASINNRQPVLPIVENGFHTGVINGGANHRRSDGVYVWDSVYFHDPRPSRPDRQFTGGSWQNYMCSSATCMHVISPGSYVGYDSYYDDYGDTTIVRGGTRQQDLQQPLY